MLFTDPCFLFLLLPIILAAYYCSPRAAKNYVLLAASVLFYALGEGVSTFVVLASIVINFFIGKWIDGTKDENARKGALINPPYDPGSGSVKALGNYRFWDPLLRANNHPGLPQ